MTGNIKNIRDYITRGGPDSAAERFRERVLGIEDGFESAFGERDGLSLFSAPGRVEIGGNHTDHQHGCVLAAAISLDALGVAAPNGTNTVRVHSKDFPADIIDLNDLTPSAGEHSRSSALIRGVAARLRELGYPVAGFDAYTTSDVPSGSGMSSSAAFEVLMGTIMNVFFCGSGVSPLDIAKAGQYAENVFFGKPCGLMDQTASAVGGVVAIDFADPDKPAVERISANFNGYALCVTKTGGDHSRLTGEYAAITDEMGSAAGYFGEKYLRNVSADTFYEQLPALREALGDRAALRAMHFFDENGRAREEAETLKQGHPDEFFRLVNESGRSSWMYLQNISKSGSSREQPTAIALALSARLLGGRGASRVHGGGFAGTILAFVPLDILDGYTAGMERLTGGGTCHVVSIREAGGVQLF